MSFIVAADGREISMRDSIPGDLTSFGIAWSLSQINRFNGHALRPYSVAEHSLLVCEIVEREFAGDIHASFAALMHDAHEAVAGDMHSPGKAEIGSAWHRWENRWQSLVRTTFSLHTPSVAFRDAIHRADLIALATEKRDLMPAGSLRWPVLFGVEPVAWVDLYSSERRQLGWEDWRDKFLDRFHQLDIARSGVQPFTGEVERRCQFHHQ